MSGLGYAGLVVRAMYELVRYDVIYAQRGFAGVRASLVRQATRPETADPDAERRICDAMVLAACLYYKRVLCLQRAVCTTRLLRAHGVPARTIIGYREEPFFSHAWVEVAARVVNDSPAYRQRLRVLHSI
jgi:hypothetical protein